MANIAAPFGFRPVRRGDTADWSTALETRQVLNSDATAIGWGDTVKETAGTGFVTRATASDAAIYGVFWGCEYFDTALQRKIWSPNWTGVTTALAGSVFARVISDLQVVFEVQTGPGGCVLADVGRNIKTLDGTVASNGFSTQAVDTGNKGQTGTFQWIVVNLSQKVGNDNASNFNTIEVQINNSQRRTGVAAP